jgi:hypothetical protein
MPVLPNHWARHIILLDSLCQQSTEADLQRAGTHADTNCPLGSLNRYKPLLGAVLAAIATAAMGSGHAWPALLKILPSSADDFVRDVLRNEVEAQEHDHALWSYSKQVREEGKQKLFRVYQTSEGEIERLVAADGRPLTPMRAQKEDQRIERLITHPAEMRQQEKKRHSDAEQAQELLRMFPEAFEFRYAGTQGSLVRLEFRPNPKFHPPNHAAQVFHHMNGTMLLDAEQKRLAAIDGTLTSEVKFFGGIFGHLDKGGTFLVQQQEVSGHFWEVTEMHIHMSGKAVFFKTIGVQEDESYSNFEAVPSDTTLSQAAEILKRDVDNLRAAQAKN